MDALKRLGKWLLVGFPFFVLTRILEPLVEDRITGAANGYLDQNSGRVMPLFARVVKFFASRPLWFVSAVILVFILVFLIEEGIVRCRVIEDSGDQKPTFESFKNAILIALERVS
jgi:hypothetical protein